MTGFETHRGGDAKRGKVAASSQPCAVCKAVDILSLRFDISGVCPDVLADIAQRSYAAGEDLTATLSGRDIAVLATGAVREEVVLKDGRRQVIAFRLAGDAVSGVTALPGYHTTAITSGMLLEFDERSLNRCRLKGGDSAKWYENLKAARIDEFRKHIVLLGRYTACERVVLFLDNVLERIGVEGTDGFHISLPMGREDIADHLGLKAETVSRHLSRLQSDGVLSLLKPGKLVIHERQRLQALLPAPAYQVSGR